MNSRDRVITALNHEEPDKVPFDLGGTEITGINHRIYRELREKLLPVETSKVKIFDKIQQLAEVEEEMKKALVVDIDGVFPQTQLVNKEVEEGNYYTFYDSYGIKWSMPKNEGFYYDMTEHPLADAKGPKDIENFDWPDPRDPALLEGLQSKVESLAESGRAVAMSVSIGGIGAGIFEMGFWLRGYKNFYLDIGRQGAMLEALLDKLVELRLEYWDAVLDEVGDLIDVAVQADDLGTQEDTMISPKMYREIVKPRHKKVFNFVKDKASDPIYNFLHSDGAIYDLIPDLIEAGVDILNPVQVNAKGMDPQKLKKEFGDALTFWGAGVDSQTTLPNGSPDQVREEVRKRMDQFARDGGYIFAPIHNIQADVPLENVVAMIDEFQKVRSY
ncbi:MAG: uroporphyrinogen decarboxylase family protein [Candidatus Bipolaricaulia bacterium]